MTPSLQTTPTVVVPFNTNRSTASLFIILFFSQNLNASRIYFTRKQHDVIITMTFINITVYNNQNKTTLLSRKPLSLKRLKHNAYEIKNSLNLNVIDLPLKHHWMQLPREVIVGNGTIERVAEISLRLGFTKSALIVAGSKTYDIAGKTVKELLEEEGLEVNTFLVDSTTVRDVAAVEERIRVLKPQVVFGVGGGTKIDVAKCSSARQEVPFISVPTTASHDGIASPLSSVKGFEKPYSVMAQAPVAIIADTHIIMQAPWRFVISGCGDVIAKLTAVKDWRLAHEAMNEYYGGYAASLALMSSKLVMQNAELIKSGSEEGLRVLIEALISCGVSMSIAGSSRPCSGSEHLFSHALDVVRPNCAMHGEQCGVGTIVMAYLHGADWRRVRGTLRRLGAPTSACELGVDGEDAVMALEMAGTIRPERYTVLSKVVLSREVCERVLRVTGVV
jgi:glycerol-1-phosphate dehydrogenase [NAD(P)+]